MADHDSHGDRAEASDEGRRRFLKSSLAAVVGSAAISAEAAPQTNPPVAEIVLDDFQRADSLYLGDRWESINPGYFEIQKRAFRRRLHNVGDRRPGTWFPWHWETHRGQPMPLDYDPSLPLGIVWRRDWKLRGGFTLAMDGTVLAAPDGTVLAAPAGTVLAAPSGGNRKWKMNRAGYAFAGLAVGGQTLFESWEAGLRPGRGALLLAWHDDGRLAVLDHGDPGLSPVTKKAQTKARRPQVGEHFRLELEVRPTGAGRAEVRGRLNVDDDSSEIVLPDVDAERLTGFVGITGRGLLDWQATRVSLLAGENRPLEAPLCDLHVCYALGDTLRERGGKWRCKFVALFRGDGGRAELRIATEEQPAGGWKTVPVAATAAIVTNDFRMSTAVFDAVLPASPAEHTLYYTVWKDGRDVTADPRPGTASTGPGTGMVGRTPASGRYVGRLPKLAPPYRICGLSCHAICENKPHLERAGKFEENWIHDQPDRDSYQHLEDYNFQVMLWEDDVWYLELIFPPPSTQDAYKVIETTLGGPTTRWQMMRHWNVVNPGDHDYGMDDVKGPEQLAIRHTEGLGQDSTYLQRNFRIVGHLSRGEEHPTGTDNPEMWRRWRMPRGDFSLLILDARLWRTSQDERLWSREGWGDFATLYGRADTTRTLLGERQFAWLEEMIATDPAPLLCATGLNSLHPVWDGVPWARRGGKATFGERDRVAADLAGWAKAGCDRVIELFGRRSGIASVYGDVHVGSILKNVRERFFECSFGPIGRYGGRALKDDFGRRMTDYNGHEVEMVALYHEKFGSPERSPISGPRYWNFLEMHFDPRPADARMELRLRNLIDPPTAACRS